MQDTQIVKRYRETGDDAYFEELYDRHYGRLKTTLAAYLKGRPGLDQQCILSDTMLAFYQHLRSDKEPIRNVQAWLYRVLHTTANTAIRDECRQKRDCRLTTHLHSNQLVGDAVEPSSKLINDEDCDRLRQSIGMLPTALQDVVMLRSNGYSSSQVAARLGLPLGTVKTRFRQALRRLRECV